MKKLSNLPKATELIKWQIWGSTSVFLFFIFGSTQLQTRPVDANVPCPCLLSFLPRQNSSLPAAQHFPLQACTLAVFALRGLGGPLTQHLLPVWFIFYLFELKLKQIREPDLFPPGNL